MHIYFWLTNIQNAYYIQIFRLKYHDHWEAPLENQSYRKMLVVKAI